MEPFEVPHQLPELRLHDSVGISDDITVPFTRLVGEPDSVMVRKNRPADTASHAPVHEPLGRPRRIEPIRGVGGEMEPKVLLASSHKTVTFELTGVFPVANDNDSAVELSKIQIRVFP